jgi:hypothetical protein
LHFSKQPIEPQEVIEISSDEESKDEVRRENKKRTLSISAAGSESPSKRRITLNTLTAIEVLSLDSDDEYPTATKAIPTKAAAAFGTSLRSVTSQAVKVQVESGADSEKMALSINEAAKDKDGRYIVTQKVKVDSIKYLQEVPARWPIPPEGTNTAYIIDLNNDKKWQEMDTNSKKKQLDSFIKREVRFTYSYGAETVNQTEKTLLFY